LPYCCTILRFKPYKNFILNLNGTHKFLEMLRIWTSRDRRRFGRGNRKIFEDDGLKGKGAYT